MDIHAQKTSENAVRAGLFPSSAPSNPILEATAALQNWLLSLRAKNLISTPVDSKIICVSEIAASRFCVGVADHRVFLGIQ